MTDPQTIRYEERVVLFLDFLGFKSLVEKTEKDEAFLTTIVDAMRCISEIGKDDLDIYKSQKISQFSDCVVASFQIEEQSAVFWLMADLAQCVAELLQRGFLVRGGMTVGSLFHSDKYIVGPAMNNAYQLESVEAKYPRILIDESVLETAGSAKKDEHTPQAEKQYVQGYLKQDADGRHYLDYVSWDGIVRGLGYDADDYPAYLSKVSEQLEDGLQEANSGVLEKYLWLHDKYISAITTLETQILDSPNQQAFQHILDDIVRLSRHTNAAATAKKKCSS